MYYKIQYFSIYRMWNSAVLPVINCFNLKWNDFCLALPKPAAFRIWIPCDRDHCKFIWHNMNFMHIQKQGQFQQYSCGTWLCKSSHITYVDNCWETRPDLDRIGKLVVNHLDWKQLWWFNTSYKLNSHHSPFPAPSSKRDKSRDYGLW